MRIRIAVILAALVATLALAGADAAPLDGKTMWGHAAGSGGCAHQFAFTGRWLGGNTWRFAWVTAGPDCIPVDGGTVIGPWNPDSTRPDTCFPVDPSSGVGWFCLGYVPGTTLTQAVTVPFSACSLQCVTGEASVWRP